jgi:hypothetical protein
MINFITTLGAVEFWIAKIAKPMTIKKANQKKNCINIPS